MDKTPPSEQVTQKDKIFMALPVYGSQMTCGFVRGLIPAFVTGLVGQIDFLENDSLVSRARNTLVDRFMRGQIDENGKEVKYDWLMFVDVDLHFTAKDMIRLWAQARKGNHKVVCGLYAMKKVPVQFVFNALAGEKPDPETQLVKVREGGTGFMIIHRSVFEEMAEKMPHLGFETDDSEGEILTRYDFFGVGPYTYPDKRRRYLSEDWMFCQRWRDLGGEVMMDTGIQIRHQGIATYPLPPEELWEAVRRCRSMGHPALPKDLV